MSKVSAKVISKNAKEIRAKSNSIVEYWGARNIRSVFVGYGFDWVPAAYRKSDLPEDSGSNVVILTSITNPFPVELIKDYILIWALPEKQEPASASLSVTVTPGGSDYDTGSVSVAGVRGENKKKLKKEGDQLGEVLADLTAQLADVAVADPVLGEEQGEALEESLQEMIKSEGGLPLQELPTLLHGFEVKEVAYARAVTGFTTRTRVFPLHKASLAQRGITRNRGLPYTLYIDIEREALRNIGLSHDNNIKAEASDLNDQFGMVNDLGALFLEMRREFVHQFEKIIDVDLDPQVTVAYTDKPVEYLASVIDNKGEILVERYKVMRILTTRTTSSKGRHVYGFRIVVDSQQRINSQRQIEDSPLRRIYSQQRSGLGYFGNKEGKFELPGCSVLLERIELNKPDGEW